MQPTKTQDKESLIDKLCALQGLVKYHYIDGDCIQYTDERSSTLMTLRKVSGPDIDGWVEWEYHFIEDNSIYIHKENIKYIQEDKEKVA